MVPITCAGSHKRNEKTARRVRRFIADPACTGTDVPFIRTVDTVQCTLCTRTTLQYNSVLVVEQSCIYWSGMRMVSRTTVRVLVARTSSAHVHVS